MKRVLRESLYRNGGYLCEGIQEEGVGMRGMPDTFNGREGEKISSKRRGAHEKEVF